MASNAKNLAELVNNQTTGFIATADLADDAVTSAKLGAGAVDTTALGADAVTNAKVADDAVRVENINAGVGLSHRNLMINGAMEIAQRGGGGYGTPSVTGVGADGSSGYLIDHYMYAGSTLGSGRYTVSKVADSPDGFGSSLKLACTATQSSLGSNAQQYIQYKWEGQELQRLNYGSSGAKASTLSFYVKGNAAAQYHVDFYADDNGQRYGKRFNVTTSWSRVEIPIAGLTTHAIDNDHNKSMTLFIWFAAGTDFTGGTVSEDAWGAYANNARVHSGITNFFDSTSRTLQFTGFQWEVNTVATDYEYRRYDDELRSCERYYQAIGQDFSDTTPQTKFATGYINSSTQGIGFLRFPRMRVKPTVTPPTDQNLDFKTKSGPGAVNSSNPFSSIITSEDSLQFTCTNHAGNFGQNGDAFFMSWNGVQAQGNTGWMQLSAEL